MSMCSCSCIISGCPSIYHCLQSMYIVFVLCETNCKSEALCGCCLHIGCLSQVLSTAYKLVSMYLAYFGLHFGHRKYQCIFNHFYVIRPESYRIRCNYSVVRAITPFKVAEFGTNRKLICDFLLVINTNLYLASFRRYSLRNVQNCYIWLPLLGLTPPPTKGFPGTISVKFLYKGHGWPRYHMA